MNKFNEAYEQMMNEADTVKFKGKVYKVGDEIWYAGKKTIITAILKNHTNYGDTVDLDNGIRTGGLDPRIGTKNQQELNKNLDDFRSIFK